MTVPNITLRILINEFKDKHKVEPSKIFLEINTVNAIIDRALATRKNENREINGNYKAKRLHIFN